MFTPRAWDTEKTEQRIESKARFIWSRCAGDRPRELLRSPAFDVCPFSHSSSIAHFFYHSMIWWVTYCSHKQMGNQVQVTLNFITAYNAAGRRTFSRIKSGQLAYEGVWRKHLSRREVSCALFGHSVHRVRRVWWYHSTWRDVDPHVIFCVIRCVTYRKHVVFAYTHSRINSGTFS